MNVWFLNVESAEELRHINLIIAASRIQQFGVANLLLWSSW